MCHELGRSSCASLTSFKKTTPDLAISCNGKRSEAKMWLKDYLWPVNMSWPWALVICARSRSLLDNMCTHYFLTEKYLSYNFYLQRACELVHRTPSFPFQIWIRTVAFKKIIMIRILKLIFTFLGGGGKICKLLSSSLPKRYSAFSH